MFFVVTYDIPDDKRRNRLHLALKNFGTPVQYSVFECILNKREFREIRKSVLRIINRKEDKVRYYPIGKDLVDKIVVDGNGEITVDEKVIVI